MRKIFLSFILLVAGVYLFGQDTLKVASGSTATIDGTSTIHDWTAIIGEVNGAFVFPESFNESPFPPSGAKIGMASISVPVSTIDGQKGETMNNKILAAFDATNHPNIQFNLTEGTVLGPKNDMDNKYVIQANGNLTMAGQTKPVELEIVGWKDDAGNMHFKAEKPIKMTTFGMKPPSAMFGQIQTGDEVVVKFDLVVK